MIQDILIERIYYCLIDFFRGSLKARFKPGADWSFVKVPIKIFNPLQEHLLSHPTFNFHYRERERQAEIHPPILPESEGI